MTGLLPYTDETKSASLSVISRIFGEKSCPQAEKILRNPLLGPQDNAGDVAFYDGRPVGTQFAIKRRLYLGQQPFFGTVGGMLAMDKNAPTVLLVELMKSTKSERWGRKLYYANTAIPVSKKMNQLLGVKGEGVASCGIVSFAVLKSGGFARFLTRGKFPNCIAKILDLFSFWIGRLINRTVETVQTVNHEEFDAFWSSYVAENEGIVSSRTGAEVDWTFGQEIKNGDAIMIVSRNDGQINGYVVVKEAKSTPGRWLVVDLIARRNDRQVLAALLKSAKAYLRRDCRAFLLECIGFPMWIQDVVRSVLPFRRRASNNSFIYQVYDSAIEESLFSDTGWFFGPYDGDRCIS